MCRVYCRLTNLPRFCLTNLPQFVLDIPNKMCYDSFQIENAKKETLAREHDRNTASPTESAVCGKRQREHSGAGCLKD